MPTESLPPDNSNHGCANYRALEFCPQYNGHRLFAGWTVVEGQSAPRLKRALLHSLRADACLSDSLRTPLFLTYSF